MAVNNQPVKDLGKVISNYNEMTSILYDRMHDTDDVGLLVYYSNFLKHQVLSLYAVPPSATKMSIELSVIALSSFNYLCPETRKSNVAKPVIPKPIEGKRLDPEIVETLCELFLIMAKTIMSRYK